MCSLTNFKRNKRPSVLRWMQQRGDESGVALVEIAILLPLFTLLLLGAFNIAMAAYTSIEVSNAAMAGVLYGAQSVATAGDVTGIQNAAAADAADIPLGTTTVSHSCICANGSTSTCLPTDCSGSAIETILTVQTQSAFTPSVRFPGIPTSFTIYGVAVQKVLQ